MATISQKFYSMKFNQPDTIKSHRTKTAAMRAAGDFGMVYDTIKRKEHQVHLMSNGALKDFEEGTQGHEYMDTRMEVLLHDKQLIPAP